jgi:hypothetical protein
VPCAFGCVWVCFPWFVHQATLNRACAMVMGGRFFRCPRTRTCRTCRTYPSKGRTQREQMGRNRQKFGKFGKFCPLGGMKKSNSHGVCVLCTFSPAPWDMLSTSPPARGEYSLALGVVYMCNRLILWRNAWLSTGLRFASKS